MNTRMSWGNVKWHNKVWEGTVGNVLCGTVKNVNVCGEMCKRYGKCVQTGQMC